MTHYKNLAGNVGICSYELGEKKIRIKFHTRKSCIYDAQNAGEDHVDKMTYLAKQGHGLNSYINENQNDLEANLLD